MKTTNTHYALTLLLLITFLALPAISVTVKMGSLAPQNSPWDDALKQLTSEWKIASGGSVNLKVYPGGIAGDEAAMILKMKSNQLSAAAITGIGMTDIYPPLLSVMLPLLYDSEAEFEYVFNKMKPNFEAEMEKRGYKVLIWTKVGWVYFFTKKPVNSIEDLRVQKMFTYAGDPEGIKAWRTIGFNPIPISTNDIMSSLQTNMIESISVTPLSAAAFQWFGIANNMCDLKWAPLIGGVVIKKSVWNKIPQNTQLKLETIAHSIGSSMQSDIDKADIRATEVMQQYGLTVTHIPDSEIPSWRAMAEKGYSSIVGTRIDPASFDEVKRHISDYRSGKR